jgi:rubrerythrin
MLLTDMVRGWLADDEAVVYECRHCGTTLMAAKQRCPTCGSTEIATFDVS